MPSFVKNLANTWKIYQQAKTWGCRPSDLLNIENDYYAYCFDEAVATWGSYVTSELEKVEGKNDKEVSNKRHRRLLQLLQAPDQVRFRSLRNPTKK